MQGVRFLIDPMLSPKGVSPGVSGHAKCSSVQPHRGTCLSLWMIFCSLMPSIVTHNHLDHWDEPAKELIPKDKPIFVQNERDQTSIQASGFTECARAR